MDDSLSYRSARGLAADIREGRISSRELVTAQLDRIATRDGETNLVVTRDPERALREADRADALRRSGAPLPPLHGVGITIKDSFMTEGMRTTSGAPELSDLVPDRDAVPVARLRAAGAVILGKTNLPIYAGDTQSYNEIFGTSANPWNLERTPGGSSGGSAGALAAGFTPLELGSDIGGSIRGPASHCGVVGHKPSYGIVPALGQIPGPPGSLTQADLAVAGPMARRVDDAELGLSILAGPDAWHAKAYRLELPEPRGRETRDYRVAVWLDEPSCPIDPEIRSHILSVAAALEKEGARVDTSARPAFEFEHAVEIFDRLLGAAMCGAFSHATIEKLAERGNTADTAGAIAAKHASQRHRGWLSANEKRLQMRAAWETFFADWDAVLMPAMPCAAPPHDHSKPMAERTIQVAGETRPYFDQLKWVGAVGVSYLPATVVPVGLTREGLPVGVQVVAPFLEDRTALDVARRIEAGLGEFARPPAFA
jgi:amidase